MGYSRALIESFARYIITGSSAIAEEPRATSVEILWPFFD